MKKRSNNDLQQGKAIPGWASAMILIAPLAIIFLGYAVGYESYREIEDTTHAEATIVEPGRKLFSDGSTTYRPTVRYQHADGALVEARVETAITDMDYAPGMMIDILYSNEDRAKVRIYDFLQLYGLGLLIAAPGFMLLLVVLWFRKAAVDQAQLPPAWEDAPPEPVSVAQSARPPALAALARKIPESVWLLAIGFFCIFILIGLYIALDATSFFANAHKTRGEVVKVEHHEEYTEGRVYYATIRYTRDDGEVIEGRTHIALGTYDFPIGHTLEIYYSPNRPDQVRIADFMSIYFGAIFFILFGALFIVLVWWLRDKARNSLITEWDQGALVQRVHDEAQRQRAGPGYHPPSDQTVRRRR